MCNHTWNPLQWNSPSRKQCARRGKYALISPHIFLVLWDQRDAGLCLWTWRQICAAVSLVRVIVTLTISGFSPCMHHVTWMRAETLPGRTKGQLFALGSPLNCGVRAGNHSQAQVFFLLFFRSPKVKIILQNTATKQLHLAQSMARPEPTSTSCLAMMDIKWVLDARQKVRGGWLWAFSV